MLVQDHAPDGDGSVVFGLLDLGNPRGRPSTDALFVRARQGTVLDVGSPNVSTAMLAGGKTSDLGKEASGITRQLQST